MINMFNGKLFIKFYNKFYYLFLRFKKWFIFTKTEKIL